MPWPVHLRCASSQHLREMVVKFFFLLFASTAVLAAPADFDNVKRVLYDQSQTGEWNVAADLKNFVILIIPTSSSSSSTTTPGGTLADFLFRAIPKRGGLKKIQKKNSVPGEETMHFIESKTAPYHVDISRSRNHLAKLHPEASAVGAEEIVIAKSPAIALVKDEGHSRMARAFVLTVPEGEHPEKKKEQKKKSNVQKSTLKLLGAENEQCGPGLYRDSEGICRVIKN